jgi:hypothetical protein
MLWSCPVNPQHWPFGSVVSVIAVFALLSGCERHVRARKEMTWQCLPEEQDPRYPEAEPVIFRYVENPEYFDVVFGRSLCAQLQSSGKTTATVTYRVWSTASQRHRLHGYSIETINNQPLQNVGGSGRSGHEGMGKSGPHPLAKALQ